MVSDVNLHPYTTEEELEYSHRKSFDEDELLRRKKNMGEPIVAELLVSTSDMSEHELTMLKVGMRNRLL